MDIRAEPFVRFSGLFSSLLVHVGAFSHQAQTSQFRLSESYQKRPESDVQKSVMKTQLSFKPTRWIGISQLLIAFLVICFILFTNSGWRMLQQPESDIPIWMFTIWIIGIIVQWYFQYGRYADISTNGHSLEIQYLTGSMRLRKDRIVRFIRLEKHQVWPWKRVYRMKLIYKTKTGKEKTIRYYADATKKKIPVNLEMYRNLVSDDQLVNFQ